MSRYANRLIAQAKAEGWKRLHLGCCGIRGPVPSEIWELEDLEELILGDFWDERDGWEYHNTKSPNTASHGLRSGIDAFPPPPAAVVAGQSAGLQRLRLLSMQRVDLADYAFLAWLPSLTALDIKSVRHGESASEEAAEAPDLLAYLARPLNSLHFEAFKVVSPEGLAKQHDLEELRIHSGKVSKELLANFPRLRYLEVEGIWTRFPLDELPDLPCLEAIFGYGWEASGTAMLRWLPQLKACSYTQDSEISDQETDRYASALRQAIHLEHLAITWPCGFDLADVAGCTQLQKLKLKCHHLLNIPVLETLQQLSSLHLHIGHVPYDHTSSETEEAAAEKKAAWLPRARQQCAEFMSAIAHLTGLEWLDLDGFPLQDLAPLGGLARLKELRIFNSQLPDLNGIGALHSLTSLMLHSAPLTDLRAISACHALRRISLADLPLSSLAGIEGAPQLEDLLIHYCQITDLGHLARLSRLTHFSIFEGPLTDLSPLRHCLALRDIRLWGLPVTDISPLAALTGLRCLELHELHVEDYSPLEPWFRTWVFADLLANEKPSCIVLSYKDEIKNPPLSSGWLRPVDALNYWDTLRLQAGETDFPWRHGVPLPDQRSAVAEHLRQSQENGLTRIDFFPLRLIGGLPVEIWDYAGLKDLNLAQSGWLWWEQKEFRHARGLLAVTHIPLPPEDSAGLPHLRSLNLSGMPIARLDFLAWMPQLKVLELRGTKVTDLSEVAGLRDLQVIDVRDTAVSDLQPLTALTALRFVFLDGSLVSDLGPLKDCSKIEKLTYTNTPAEHLEKGAL